MNLYIILIYIVIISLIFRFYYVNKSFSNRDPVRASWIAIPIFGHFYGMNFLKPFYEISKNIKHLKKHKLISFWFMDIYMVLLLHPKSARDFLVKNSDVFLNRPIIYTNQVLTHNFAGVSQARDLRWENIRTTFSSLSTNIILRKKTNYVEDKIKETMLYLNKLQGKNIKTWTITKPMLVNIFYEYFQISEPFEKTINDPDSLLLIDQVFEILSKTQGKPLLNSHVFGLFFGLFHKINGLEIVEKPYRILKKKLLDPHLETIDRDHPRDTIDELILLNESYPPHMQFEHNILAPILDFFNAGLNSTSILIEWFILIMINNQDVQENIYKELSSINNEFISIKDRYDTPYLNSVLWEVIRYRLGTSTAPRVAKEDIEIDGFFVPKGTAVAIITSTIFMDEDYWDEPEKFIPERFIGEPKGHMERMLLYGVGKRSCLGKNLAQDINYLFCANTILNFKFKSGNGKKLSEVPNFRLNAIPQSHDVIFEKR